MVPGLHEGYRMLEQAQSGGVDRICHVFVLVFQKSLLVSSRHNPVVAAIRQVPYGLTTFQKCSFHMYRGRHDL